VTALGFVLYSTASLIWGCLALAVSWALVLGMYDLRVVRSLAFSSQVLVRPIWNRQALLSLMTVALPLGLVMGLASLQVNVPRYVLGRSLSLADVGIFSAMASLGVVGTTICNAIGQAASPRLANDYASSDRRSFVLTVTKLLAVAFATGIAGMAVAATIGEWLLTILFRPEYGHSQDVFLVLMFAAGFSCLASVLGYALTAARQFRCQIPIFTAALVVTAAICVCLTPAMGLLGAAIGTAAGSLTQTIGATWALLSTAGVRTEMRRFQWAAE
jgi:O-antigen/teichoic acid export membrane protein